ncbi:hypothetical protein EVAR_61596_1 [Eumeta japonica]|uniref:Uncharacterized protein n=1 Tax=Eumeta variegata TaxID=151549 RepID=A0A4C1YG73_EUMVA|nr:hypothetical protein EVAR_61596_1 [Eumeta japonica]
MPPMNTRRLGGVTNTLPVSWVGIRYLIEDGCSISVNPLESIFNHLDRDSQWRGRFEGQRGIVELGLNRPTAEAFPPTILLFESEELGLHAVLVRVGGCQRSSSSMRWRYPEPTA